MTLTEDSSQTPPSRRRLIKLNVARLLVAGALLVAGFGALFLLLLPGSGGGGSVEAALMVDTSSGTAGASPGVHRGDLARNFVASDIEELRHTLSDLRGRPVVINFWATWCTSCLAEMPVLEEQRIAHADEDLAIIAVNVGEGLGKAGAFIDSLELSDFVIAMDPDLTISDAYSVRGLPHSVFIDRDGVIQAEYRGQLDEETMNSYVQAAIDAAPADEEEPRPRFVTTVPREHLLEVFPDGSSSGVILFVSRRFRCDDDYCGDAIASSIRTLTGVTGIDLSNDQPEPALEVSYDVALVDFQDVVDAVAAEVREFEDPLYSRELEVRFAN